MRRASESNLSTIELSLTYTHTYIHARTYRSADSDHSIVSCQLFSLLIFAWIYFSNTNIVCAIVFIFLVLSLSCCALFLSDNAWHLMNDISRSNHADRTYPLYRGCPITPGPGISHQWHCAHGADGVHHQEGSDKGSTLTHPLAMISSMLGLGVSIETRNSTLPTMARFTRTILDCFLRLWSGQWTRVSSGRKTTFDSTWTLRLQVERYSLVVLQKSRVVFFAANNAASKKWSSIPTRRFLIVNFVIIPSIDLDRVPMKRCVSIRSTLSIW